MYMHSLEGCIWPKLLGLLAETLGTQNVNGRVFVSSGGPSSSLGAAKPGRTPRDPQLLADAANLSPGKAEHLA